MTGSRAADVFVSCVEAEGVRHVFGIPGEETLDLNHSLAHSSIEFVPVRHEQGAFMAWMYGRLTGRAAVCLGTLGPDALNLVTGVADALLDRVPLAALTAQRPLEWMHKESHQYDAVSGRAAARAVGAARRAGAQRHARLRRRAAHAVDFVGVAESFGMPAWRCDSAGDFGRRLRHALSLDVPTLLVLPIDYALDIATSENSERRP
jgi:thiamine pyrophosphate-dependent acetolactate synthase large subunit-like protein